LLVDILHYLVVHGDRILVGVNRINGRAGGFKIIKDWQGSGFILGKALGDRLVGIVLAATRQ